jgi:hypothetical protein
MAHTPFRPPPARIIKTLYAIGLGPLVGRFILLLTTTVARPVCLDNAPPI